MNGEDSGPSRQRQAIVIIHGVGEQRPMATLRSFTNALILFCGFKDVIPAWSKPDTISEGFEHRRFTLPGARDRPVTDVYELYWAHLFEQASYSTLRNWLARLAFHPLQGLPRRYWAAVMVIRILFFGAVAAIYLALKDFVSMPMDKAILWLPAFVLVYVFGIYQLDRFFLGTVSDAARYLDAHPRNVASRNAVRHLGVSFLDALHKSERGYGRIVLCGHSLGSVIGYDILQHLWYRYRLEHSRPLVVDQPELSAKYDAVASLDAAMVQAWQSRVFLEMKSYGSPWRVTDFITMGSPLSKADVLFCDSKAEFDSRMRSGELAACPPSCDLIRKNITEDKDYTTSCGQRRTLKVPTQSSVFAMVRWSNISFPTHAGVFGDAISGRLTPLFGNGIVEYHVRATGIRRWFSHTSYWDGDSADLRRQDSPLHALRAAMRLNVTDN